MKMLNQFQCEICNTVYKSEDECRNCESYHNSPVRINKSVFNSRKNDGQYPVYVYIEMSNGTVMRYKED